MSVEVENDSEAKEQFRSIDATTPDGITVIPYGTRELSGDEYLVYPNGTATIQKLVERSGMEYTAFEDRKSSTIVERSEELTIATLYIGYRFLRDNWDQINFLIQKISGYYYENSDKEIEMKIEQEDSNGDTKKITYQGPADELGSVTDELESIMEGSSDE